MGSFRSIFQWLILENPSFKQSNTPGFSLAIELWTVSTQLEHRNGVINKKAIPFKTKCWITLSAVSLLEEISLEIKYKKLLFNSKQMWLLIINVWKVDSFVELIFQ